MEDFLRRLLAGMTSPAPVPAPVPEVPMVEKLLQRLVAETQSCKPAPVVPPIGKFVQIVYLGAADSGTAVSAETHQAGLEWHRVFFMREGGS